MFRPQNLPTAHLSSSDPANNPLTASAFLSGGADAGPLLNTWHDSFLEAPQARAMEQEVTIQSQAAAAAGSRHSDPSFLERDGLPASAYEPKTWMGDLSPKPYVDVNVPHNHIEGALGVASASIPWDYRSYAGELNSHRKAEPLIYSPLVLAKDASGESAVDLTSLINRKYTAKRNSASPEYAATLSGATEYSPQARDPTSSWMPSIPLQKGPKKSWEKHFLDLYAPTPPPLLAPVAPRMPKSAREGHEEDEERSMIEKRAAAAPLPSFLTRKERVKAMVTPLFDKAGAAVQYHDRAAAEARIKASHEVDIFAPAHAPVPTAGSVARSMEHDHAPAVFLEVEDVMEQEDGLEQFDIDLPFPEAQHKEVFPW